MLTNELRYFFAVATSCSLSTASEQLFVAGSAISRQIQKLESRLGVTLFEHHARGMVLTDAGQILANHVRKSMRDMEFALAEIQGLKAVRKALVRIACTDGMAFDLLPGLLARFRQQHPGVNFDLQVGTALQVRSGSAITSAMSRFSSASRPSARWRSLPPGPHRSCCCSMPDIR